MFAPPPRPWNPSHRLEMQQELQPWEPEHRIMQAHVLVPRENPPRTFLVSQKKEPDATRVEISAMNLPSSQRPVERNTRTPIGTPFPFLSLLSQKPFCM